MNTILKNKILIGLFLFPILSFSQQNKYFLYLKDKTNSPYSINVPEEFLSPKALERRNKQGISIIENDLPINPNYLDSIAQNGAKIWYSSKWFNGVLIEADSITYQNLLEKSFVKNINYIGKIASKDTLKEEIPFYEVIKYSKTPSLNEYGPSLVQNMMLEADEMHQLGFDGKGMTIGIFDSGFENVDVLPVFDSLNLKNKIKGTFDYVENDTEVYDKGIHGTMILSTIGGYSKGNLIGTAYNADYYLFVTEDVNSEKRIEEYNWLFAAEKADSLGIDIINTSLGYTQFDDSSMNYSYQDLDGNTAIITKAVDLAASKGILCVNSAGNSGQNSWYYIGAPADADSVLAVGAVDSSEIKVGFSSFGPSADGRVKPNLCAQGANIVACLPNGYFVRTNGTSFASPILCGLAAGLWQANPSLTNMEVINFLEQSGTQFTNPNELCGYGIPKFLKANNLANNENPTIFNKNELLILPNPLDLISNSFLSLELTSKENILKIVFYDAKGSFVFEKINITKHKALIDIKEFIDQKGIYIVKIITNSKTYSGKIIVY